MACYEASTMMREVETIVEGQQETLQRFEARIWGSHACRIPGRVYVGALEIGGSLKCRGVVASRHIYAGELLLAERALVTCLEKPRQMEVAVVIKVLRARQENFLCPLWAAFQGLHPVALSSVSAQSKASAIEKMGEALMIGENGFEERLRLALAAQFNKIDQSVFARLSMFNHACGFAANAIRIDGESGLGSLLLRDTDEPIPSEGYVEVYATRAIEAGEQIFIGYDQPAESASGRRRARLREAYDFECECRTCALAFNDNAAENNVEDGLLALELVLDQKDSENAPTRSVESDAQAALERAIGELGQSSPLVLRARRLVMRAANRNNDTPGFVAKALLLRTGEIDALGSDHIKVAITCLVAADAIELALTEADLPPGPWHAVIGLGSDVPKPQNDVDSISLGDMRQQLEHLELRLRLHAEGIAVKYRASRASMLRASCEQLVQLQTTPTVPSRPSRYAHRRASQQSAKNVISPRKRLVIQHSIAQPPSSEQYAETA